MYDIVKANQPDDTNRPKPVLEWEKDNIK